ncbi:SIS domain-containing protein [Agromyces albus]|uniref:SIS domain-containing protein n=1 Tax=Agromyces albus TaxID=205332 RepID=UPI0027899279|nr:SIS domain-containing protein [Agromyces albus]MDQ0576750.1 fructoselysine-6-phosphate deglycase [Agromyces albus]
MLNFDDERFLRIQAGAVALAEPIDAFISERLAAGATNVFFLGSGGAGILMQPAVRLLQTRSTFPTFHEMPAELVETGSVHLGAGSIVVIPSLSGTTAESIRVLEYAQERGATVLTLTGHPDTPLAEAADLNLTTFAADDTSSETFSVQSLLVALSIMRARGEFPDYDAVLEQLQALPDALLGVKRGFEERAAELARVIAASDFHVITGAGASWPEAFYYGMCILEEMQWIRTRPVHASDFFHGTLELLEPGVSVIALKGEDAGRALVERVEAFVPRVTDSLIVIDTADFELLGFTPEVRALLAPALLATALERVSAHLEVLRDHPLTTRRYYRQLQY